MTIAGKASIHRVLAANEHDDNDLLECHAGAVQIEQTIAVGQDYGGAELPLLLFTLPWRAYPSVAVTCIKCASRAACPALQGNSVTLCTSMLSHSSPTRPLG
jgi:hypothetical protein